MWLIRTPSCAVLCCAVLSCLQFFDGVTKQYTIQMLADRQVIRHTLEHTLWRMARKSDAGTGPAAAAAAAAGAAAGQGPEREGLVGQRIEVWWPAEKTFFAGRVAVSWCAEGHDRGCGVCLSVRGVGAPSACLLQPLGGGSGNKKSTRRRRPCSGCLCVCTASLLEHHLTLITDECWRGSCTAGWLSCHRVLLRLHTQAFNSGANTYTVEYDDGDVQEENLSKSKWRIEGGSKEGASGAAAGGGAGRAAPKPAAPAPPKPMLPPGLGGPPGGAPRVQPGLLPGGLPGTGVVVHPQALVGQSIRIWQPVANEWVTGDVTVSTQRCPLPNAHARVCRELSWLYVMCRTTASQSGAS